MIDKYGRSIDYLRISLTDNCNLRCVYCMPPDVKFDRNYINDDLSLEDYKFLIKSMSDLGITKVRFTGGEPLLYPHLIELIRFTKQECGIDDIGITTNGTGLYEIAKELKASGLDKVNISLDSLKEYKYKSITRGGQLKYVLKSITTCISLGIKVRINCVVIDGFNEDELYDFMMMTTSMPIDIRFIELMPIGEAKKMYNRGYFDIKGELEQIGELYPIKLNEKSVAKYYKFNGSKGKIGVIAPLSSSFCSSCNKIRITSSGTIKLCLHSREEIDIKPYLQKPLIFRETMKDIILEKPRCHNLVENQYSDTYRGMYEIGG